MNLKQSITLYFAFILILFELKTFEAQNSNSSTINDINCGFKGLSLSDVKVDNSTQHDFILAGPREFRWMVLVQITTPVTTRHNWCAGTLINSQWVLTAGHCTVALENGSTFTPESLTVVAGAYNIAKVDFEEAVIRVVRNVTSVRTHPKYSHNESAYDMSLLKLEFPLDMTAQTVAPRPDHFNGVCLPTRFDGKRADQLFGGRQCIVTGWEDELPDIVDLNSELPLLRVSTPIVANEVCAKQYASQNETIIDSMICTGGKGSAEAVWPSTCRLLPGGPVVCLDQATFQWTMVAVNSGTFTSNCLSKRLPDVSVAIDSLTIEWIKNTLKEA